MKMEGFDLPIPSIFCPMNQRLNAFDRLFFDKSVKKSEIIVLMFAVV